MKVIIQNFRCYTFPAVTFTFENNKITNLDGISGAGKSTIFMAITWCLYGGFRGSQLKPIFPHIPSDKDKYEKNRIEGIPSNGTGVILFINDITIKRTAAATSSIEIIDKDGNSISPDSAQCLIFSEFKTLNLWQASSYISQNERNPLMVLSNADKFSLLYELTFSSSIDEETSSPEWYIKKISNALSGTRVSATKASAKTAVLRDQLDSAVKKTTTSIEITGENEEELKHKISCLYKKFDSINNLRSTLVSKEESLKTLITQIDKEVANKQKYEQENEIVDEEFHETIIHNCTKLHSFLTDIIRHSTFPSKYNVELAISFLQESNKEQHFSFSFDKSCSYIFTFDQMIDQITQYKLLQYNNNFVKEEQKIIFAHPELKNKSLIELALIRNKKELSTTSINEIECNKCGNRIDITYKEYQKIPLKTIELYIKLLQDKEKFINLNKYIDFDIEFDENVKISNLNLVKNLDPFYMVLKKLKPPKNDVFFDFSLLQNSIKNLQSFSKLIDIMDDMYIKNYNKILQESSSIITRNKNVKNMILIKSEIIAKYETEKKKLESVIDKIKQQIDSEADEDNSPNHIKDRANKMMEKVELLNIQRQYNSLSEKIKQSIEEEKIIAEKIVCLTDILKIASETARRAVAETVKTITKTTNIILRDLFATSPTPLEINFSLSDKTVCNQNKISTISLQIIRNGITFDGIKLLSGGESDRVSLALTIAFSMFLNSSFILLDECMSSLDDDMQSRCFDVIRKYLPNRTILNICHSIENGLHDNQINIKHAY